jgi:hypothetical protein
MKRLFLLTAIIIIFHEISCSQSETPASKPILEVFTDFHVNLEKGSASTTGFNLNRAFFGYNFAIDNNFFAVIILNVASPDDLARGSKARRYAFLREASMNYTNDKLTLTMGMVKTKMFMFQQGWWGMRYVAKPFQELNGYGTDSDLGVAATYKFSEMFEADLSVINGEGGGNLQSDNNVKSSAGLSFKPTDKITIRLYDDMMKNMGLWQNTSVLFAGFKTENYFLGAELNYKTNLDTISGHNAWGISATGGVNFFGKLMFFLRYDLSKSVVPQGDIANWNYENDGQFLVLGLQYAITKSLRLALDYQSQFPDSHDKSVSHMIYLNLAMKI